MYSHNNIRFNDSSEAMSDVNDFVSFDASRFSDHIDYDKVNDLYIDVLNQLGEMHLSDAINTLNQIHSCMNVNGGRAVENQLISNLIFDITDQLKSLLKKKISDEPENLLSFCIMVMSAAQFATLDSSHSFMNMLFKICIRQIYDNPDNINQYINCSNLLRQLLDEVDTQYFLCYNRMFQLIECLVTENSADISKALYALNDEIILIDNQLDFAQNYLTLLYQVKSRMKVRLSLLTNTATSKIDAQLFQDSIIFILNLADQRVSSCDYVLEYLASGYIFNEIPDVTNQFALVAAIANSYQVVILYYENEIIKQHDIQENMKYLLKSCKLFYKEYQIQNNDLITWIDINLAKSIDEKSIQAIPALKMRTVNTKDIVLSNSRLPQDQANSIKVKSANPQITLNSKQSKIDHYFISKLKATSSKIPENSNATTRSLTFFETTNKSQTNVDKENMTESMLNIQRATCCKRC